MAICAVFLPVRNSDSSSSSRLSAFARVVGDSVIPARAMNANAAFGSAIYDTLRVVEFVLRGDHIREAAVMSVATGKAFLDAQLRRAPNGEWRARVLVPRDVLEVELMVNNGQRSLRVHSQPVSMHMHGSDSI
jgi:hypothetical protein